LSWAHLPHTHELMPTTPETAREAASDVARESPPLVPQAQ
jgi:hypothetical protein